MQFFFEENKILLFIVHGNLKLLRVLLSERLSKFQRLESKKLILFKENGKL